MTPDEFAKQFGPEAAKAAQAMIARVRQAQELSIVTHLALISLFSGFEPSDQDLRAWISTFCPDDGPELHEAIVGKFRDTVRMARQLAERGEELAKGIGDGPRH